MFGTLGISGPIESLTTTSISVENSENRAGE